MIQVDHIIFLIHPCCYEPIGAQQVRADGLQLFVDRERLVKDRWLKRIAQGNEATLYVQLGGPDDLLDAGVSAFGEARALALKFPFPGGSELPAYYEGLSAEIRTHLATHDVQWDADTVTSELWGESFEGCVPGYGGAFAQYLQLTRSPVMCFDMTVFDSRFLHQARRVETHALDGTDVEAWLFECHDGTGALTFQARHTAQWLDERAVSLRLHDRRHQLCDKLGHTVWPQTPWTKGKTEEEHDLSVPMKDWIWRWVRGVGTDFETFRSVATSARLV